jgi:plasminogen activator
MRKAECLGLILAGCFAAGGAFGQSLGQSAAAAPTAAPASVTVRSGIAAALTDRLSAEAYLGYMSGESQELVYGDTGKISQLNWTIENAAIVGGRLSYAATGWLSLGVGGWTSFASDDTMVDYDWLLSDRDGWSDRSTHPNTSLERAFEFDLSAAGRIADWRGLRVDGLLGYQVRNFKWRASDGNYTYSSFGFRDNEGQFEGPVVDYQQWWRTPYVGLGAGYALPGLRLSGKVIASPFAQVEDADVHIENAQRFTGDFGDTTMTAVTLRAEHDLTENMMLTGEANYQKFWEARGDMTVSYLNLDGWTSTLADAAGASNETLILSLGLAYRF